MALFMGACMPHALGLPPLLTPPAPWSETVTAAYKNAQTVAKVKVLQAERASQPEVWPGTFSTETALVEPVKIYKGKAQDVPKSFYTRFSGTTGDRPPKFVEGTEPVVFLSPEGNLLLLARAFPPATYEETLQLLEQYTAPAQPRLRQGASSVFGAPQPLQTEVAVRVAQRLSPKSALNCATSFCCQSQVGARRP